MAEQALASADPLVRTRGARRIGSSRAGADPAARARLLDDNHPAVRKLVADGLAGLAAKPELGEPIRSAAMAVLAGDRWQGQQQATLLLGSLEHHRRPVGSSNCWNSHGGSDACGRLGAAQSGDPQTAPAIVDKLRRQTAERKRQSVTAVSMSKWRTSSTPAARCRSRKPCR